MIRPEPPPRSGRERRRGLLALLASPTHRTSSCVGAVLPVLLGGEEGRLFSQKLTIQTQFGVLPARRLERRAFISITHGTSILNRARGTRQAHHPATSLLPKLRGVLPTLARHTDNRPADQGPSVWVVVSPGLALG